MSQRSFDFSMKEFIKTELKDLQVRMKLDPRDILPYRTETFLEKFMKDDKGDLIQNDVVHKMLQRFRRKCQRKGFNKFLVVGAWGLGKSEQLCIGVALHEIAKNPNILIKIIHVSEDSACDRVRTIKEYIDKDEDFKSLCPHIEQTPIWGQKKFIVKRKAISKDATVQGYGVLSTALGGRAHLLIFDDPQDLKTAVLEPSTREAIEKTFRNVWMSRMIPGNSEAIVLMNKWSDVDLANTIKNIPTWAWMEVGVSEDKESLFYKDSFGENKLLPLWKAHNKAWYEAKYIELGERDYNRGYRLIPYSNEDKTFPAFERCCKFGINSESIVSSPKDWIYVGGIDFAGIKRPGTILTIAAQNLYTGLKVPVNIYIFKNPSDLVEGIIDTWKTYGVELYFAENNAVQGAIIDLITSKLNEEKFKRLGIRVEGCFTGKNKGDQLTGLPSLNKEMEKDEWIFPFIKMFTNVDTDEKDVWARFYRECLNHPFYVSTDIVMSLWFCSRAFKEINRKSQTLQIW